MQFTNSLWHRLLHLLPEPSEVWSFFKLSYKISVTAFCHTLISHHLTWKVMQYFTKVWIIMCIKYLVLPNFRVFQVIHEPFLNIISNISSYFRGIQKSTFWVTKGGPLPFSFDPLSKVFKYGNRCFAKYPAGIPDYFKQVFPAGMSFERTVTYEDGGVATASGHFRYKNDD